MKNVLELLFKDKPLEDQPKICVIKTQSTVTPEEQLSYEEWCKEHNVSIEWHSREGIHNANSMMKLWTGAKKSIIG